MQKGCKQIYVDLPDKPFAKAFLVTEGRVANSRNGWTLFQSSDCAEEAYVNLTGCLSSLPDEILEQLIRNFCNDPNLIDWVQVQADLTIWTRIKEFQDEFLAFVILPNGHYWGWMYDGTLGYLIPETGETETKFGSLKYDLDIWVSPYSDDEDGIAKVAEAIQRIFPYQSDS